MSGISSSLAQPIFVFSVLIISFKENLPKWNIDQCLSEISTCSGKRLLVESMIWRDRNLKFGPNYDLEEDNLEKKIKIWRGAAVILDRDP